MTLLKSETVVFPGAVADGVRAAVQSTFASICGGSLTLAPEPNPVAGGPGLVGIISFLGDVNWSFALGLPRDTVTALAARYDIPVQASVDVAMACGTGVCMGCVLPVTGNDGITRIVRSCVDGPVFRADLVRWDDMGTIPFDALGAPGWKPAPERSVGSAESRHAG